MSGVTDSPSPDQVDEFSFLPEQAAEAGIDAPIPHVERLSLTLGDGRTLSALRYGDAPPVVTLLHGAGLNAHTWDTTVLALGLPALALDLPGHGDSSWRTDAAYAPRVLAADVAAAIEAWTSRPQLLVGQSLGGLTAAATAAAHPSSVSAVVVVDASPGIDLNGDASVISRFFEGPTDWASREELTERALAFGLGGTPQAAARGVYFNSRIRPDGRVEWKHHFAHIAGILAADPAAAQAAGAAQAEFRAALGAAGWEDFAGVQAPLTLIRGERGFLTDADLAEFTTRLPQASVVTVPSGHNVQEEIPADLGARLAALAGKD